MYIIKSVGYRALNKNDKIKNRLVDIIYKL